MTVMKYLAHDDADLFIKVELSLGYRCASFGTISNKRAPSWLDQMRQIWSPFSPERMALTVRGSLARKTTASLFVIDVSRDPLELYRGALFSSTLHRWWVLTKQLEPDRTFNNVAYVSLYKLNPLLKSTAYLQPRSRELVAEVYEVLVYRIAGNFRG